MDLQLSYCKFCIYTHPVNSKYTIWQVGPFNNFIMVNTEDFFLFLLPAGWISNTNLYSIYSLSIGTWNQRTGTLSIWDLRFVSSPKDHFTYIHLIFSRQTALYLTFSLLFGILRQNKTKNKKKTSNTNSGK